jgi:alginate O-acetyltransferase complex protein AlgI
MVDGPAIHHSIGTGLFRICCGLFRFVMVLVLFKNGRIERFTTNPASLTNYQFMVALYVTAMNMYLWISGYADCSIGIGRMMGFRIPENFNYPWRSTSVGEFWRRWHLTLGSWLRDYVYIPLGGNRRHVTLNYLITFVLCGLWHGLYLSYAMWGLFQGIGLAIGRVWKHFWTRQAERQTPLYRTLDRAKLVNSPITIGMAWLLTFNYEIVTVAWFLDERQQIIKRIGRLLAG